MPLISEEPNGWRRFGAATILSRQPLILYTSIASNMPLGIGSLFSKRFGPYPATFLITPSWTIERKERAHEIHRAAELERRLSPSSEFIFFCNTVGEKELLISLGEKAHFINHNAAISEEFFKPVKEAPLEYHAVYNARFDAFKRHELARKIPSVAYIGYAVSSANHDYVRNRIVELVSQAGHVILNDLREGVPIWMSPEQVNDAYSKASVGLCLSALEGAMLSSMEYMLAGLPIVSTPSKGGRDVFFSEDHCLIVQPDEHAVAIAVEDLVQRGISRDDVRDRALAAIGPHRTRFLNVLNEILARNGSRERFGPEWPFHARRRLLRWEQLENLVPELSAIVAGLSADADAVPLSQGTHNHRPGGSD